MNTTSLANFMGLAETLTDLDSACASWKKTRPFLLRIASISRQLAWEIGRISVNDFQIDSQLSDLAESLRHFSNTFEGYIIIPTRDSDKILAFRRELVDLINLTRYMYEKLKGLEILVPDKEYLRYQSFDRWPYSVNERTNVNRYAPQSTIQLLSEAGQSLATGAYRGAATLSLQAVETMLRYYCIRLNGPEVNAWGPMLNWLCPAKKSKTPLSKHPHLCKILWSLLETRNALAHGHTNLGTRGDEVAERILKESFEAVRDLIHLELSSSASSLSRLDAIIHINPQLDFDTILALFIWRWNPDFPRFGLGQVVLDDRIKLGVIFDESVKREMHRDNDAGLARKTCEHIRLQADYEMIVRPLIVFALEKMKAKERSKFVKKIDIAELFEGVLEENDDDALQTLINTWNLLDKFLETSYLHPRSETLVEDLDAENFYQAFLRRQRRQFPSVA